MKTKTLQWIIPAVFFITLSGNAAATDNDYSDNFTDRYGSPHSQDMVVNNYYLDHGDYIYDYYYASRIRRFHQPFVSFGYYNSYYTDCYWYTYDPVYWGFSIYVGSFWNPVRLRVSYGVPVWRTNYYAPYYSWHGPSFYSYYYAGPYFGVVYRPAFVSHYYYGNWYSYGGYYSRPYHSVYMNRPYYARYEDNYNYYSRSARNERSLGSRYYSNRNSGTSSSGMRTTVQGPERSGQQRAGSTSTNRATQAGTRQGTVNNRNAISTTPERNRQQSTVTRSQTRTSDDAVRSRTGTATGRTAVPRSSSGQVRSSGTRTSTSAVRTNQPIPSRSSATVRSTQSRSKVNTELRKPSVSNRSTGVRSGSTSRSKEMKSTRSSGSKSRTVQKSSSSRKKESGTTKSSTRSRRKK